MTSWLHDLAPYCGELARTTCSEDRAGRQHMCVAEPSHERGTVEYHVCACGYGWTTQPRKRNGIG